MRQVTARKQNRKLKTGHRTRATGNRTPLAEGIVQLRSNGQRDWASLTDAELIEYARRFVDNEDIKNRRGLAIRDCSLYQILKQRKLLDRIGLEETNRRWAAMNDKELVAVARRFIQKKGICNKRGLRREDGGLYRVLLRRNLFDRLNFEKESRNWSAMDKEELVQHVQVLVNLKGIKSRSGLKKEDGGLYQALCRRKLIGKLEFKDDNRKWSTYTDQELVQYAKRHIEEKGVKSRKELVKEDRGLHHALRQRKLLDKVGFEIKKERRRDWASMSDEEIVDFAKRFVEENKIKRRWALEKQDSGLYGVLSSRKLLERIGLEKTRKTRDWRKMSDEEIVAFAKRFVEGKGIRSRSALKKEDEGLLLALRKRNLLEMVGIEKIRHTRDWNSMKDKELVEHARKIVDDKGVTNRGRLSREDSGLYKALLKRELLDKIFSAIERSKQRAFRKQLLLGLSQAADSMEQFGERG